MNQALCPRRAHLYTWHVIVHTHAPQYFQDRGVVSAPKSNGIKLFGAPEIGALVLGARRAGRFTWAERLRQSGVGLPGRGQQREEGRGLPFTQPRCPLASEEPHLFIYSGDPGRVSEDTTAVWAFVKTWIKMQINDHNSWPLNGTSSWKPSKSFAVQQNASFSNNTVKYKQPQSTIKRKCFKYSHNCRCIWVGKCICAYKLLSARFSLLFSLFKPA